MEMVSCFLNRIEWSFFSVPIHSILLKLRAVQLAIFLNKNRIPLRRDLCIRRTGYKIPSFNKLPVFSNRNPKRFASVY
ncbi:hypothetical protein LEP1GSC047_0787 [Leptospira inadai serovar Lyme str. 10]|uniref:Uncharacterized protein n=1 Tax=Leptospira inadai serovar Lyme str. 10 TaxID=1049790 RepID=V6HDD1_9LEPT|nr:hypothetical protein LEP1GSC047_0787 [Leptospira inadai serovar Lyme str. 10]